MDTRQRALGEALMDFHYPAGATPLDPDSGAGLIPGIMTQQELDEFEQQNMGQVLLWARIPTVLLR